MLGQRVVAAAAAMLGQRVVAAAAPLTRTVPPARHAWQRGHLASLDRMHAKARGEPPAAAR
jgi:hypothetical protein